MNVINQINKDQIEKFKGQKDFNAIPLKSEVSLYYLTPGKDQRMFKGIVIAKQEKGIMTAITITKTDANPGKRLTQKFLLYSPNIIKITVTKNPKNKPRRAKLNYMENLFGKKARI